ncbi:RNA polymerase sigma factor [Frigoriglobus tundricola]|uniref:RNA polymerase sigma factor n=1 Tax=Frigoriglobus tundricola TaxID=2774151 RepID=UPI001D05CFBD|nr:sigma-70 family RNA polymerase sigma factor [Frigoriglobus tundricola]
MPHLEPRRVRALLRTESRSAPTSDAELLARFAADRDESAFAELVVRHGRLVLGTARRYLGDAHAAEDVCQAAFLVLARKAGAQRWGPTVGPWLHATAVRLARKAGRWVHPTGPAEVPARGTDPAAAAAWCETCRALDEELAALREVVRGPLVLCYLQGRTRDEAAAALGCSLTMLKRAWSAGGTCSAPGSPGAGSACRLSASVPWPPTSWSDRTRPGPQHAPRSRTRRSGRPLPRWLPFSAPARAGPRPWHSLRDWSRSGSGWSAPPDGRTRTAPPPEGRPPTRR